MKKIVALFCTLTMLFAFAAPAFASVNNEGSLAELLTMYMSAEQKSETTFELNKPLKFLSIFNEEIGIDVQYLVESILKSKINITTKCEAREGMKAYKLYMQLNPVVPVEISKDLKFSADLNLEIWIDMDFTNTEDAYFKLICKNPVNGKYCYLDLGAAELSEYLGDLDAVAEMLGKLNQDAMKEINSKVFAFYEKYATIKKDGDYIEMSFTNDSFVDLLFDIFDEFYLSENAELNNESVAQAWQELGLTKETLPQVKFLMKSLGIFADNDAVVTKFKLDKDGFIVQEESKIRFDFNIFDILSVMGLQEGDVYPLTRDIADLDITIVVKTDYISTNENIDINMPELTEENSSNLLEESQPSYEETVEFVYQPEVFWNYATGMQNENGLYINMVEFKLDAEWNGDADNLECGLGTNENNDVTLKFKSDNFDTVTLTGNVNSDTYYLNGVAVAGNKPFEIVNGVIFAKIDVLNCVLGAEISSVTVSYYNWTEKLDSPEMKIEIMRPNPGYTESEISEEFFDFPEDATIGVIGGSDGPTTIFVTGME